ncbi:MAG: IS110 family transposase [Planctomycetes bacterium]|nr:IS110 family transposase [Planctomycetota bacterium]
MSIPESRNSTFIGIDVSKDKIDIAEHYNPTAKRSIGNNEQEITQWISSLKETSQTLVVMEATGGPRVGAHQTVPIS